MVAVVFALVSSLGYGISDFYGAIAARRLGAVATTLAGYTSGVVLIGGALLFVPGAWSFDAVLFGAIAGVGVALGFLAFYASFAIGPVSVLAPLIAVLYATVPVGWSLGRGEQLPPVAWGGVALGIIAVLALSIPPRGGAENADERAAEQAAGRGTGPSKFAIVLGILAALGMGAASIALDYAPKNSGLTPAFIETAVAVLLLAIVFVFVPRPAKGSVDYPALGIALGSGVLLAIGNSLFLIALQNGSLALVGVLVSLYPLSTILLARFVLKEHISRVQWAGIGLAVLSAVLMGIG